LLPPLLPLPREISRLPILSAPPPVRLAPAFAARSLALERAASALPLAFARAVSALPLAFERAVSARSFAFARAASACAPVRLLPTLPPCDLICSFAPAARFCADSPRAVPPYLFAVPWSRYGAPPRCCGLCCQVPLRAAFTLRVPFTLRLMFALRLKLL